MNFKRRDDLVAMEKKAIAFIGKKGKILTDLLDPYISDRIYSKYNLGFESFKITGVIKEGDIFKLNVRVPELINPGAKMCNWETENIYEDLVVSSTLELERAWVGYNVWCQKLENVRKELVDMVEDNKPYIKSVIEKSGNEYYSIDYEKTLRLLPTHACVYRREQFNSMVEVSTHVITV